MVAIVPRWEWRTFGMRFGPAEAAFAALTPGGVQESEELYLLSGGDASAKIRDDLMDIKVLQEVNADGLEQWIPVMKTGFPLSATDVSNMFEALGLDLPQLNREAYTLDQLLAEVIEPDGRLRPVEVHKRRVRYTVGGCMAEVSDVEVNGEPIRTIAIEATDPSAVISSVRAMGLGGYVNTSYPRGLAAVLDRYPTRFAVIDVGTNSVKFHIAELGDDASWKKVVDRAEVTRLGEGLEQHGEITREPMERTATAITAMLEEARRYDSRAIAVVGTAGLRMAQNAAEIVEAIQEHTGISIEVISGEEEGRLAYLAVQAGLGLGEGSLVVFDTGGGSTQFTFGRGPEVAERFSVEVGAVRFTERFRLDGVVARRGPRRGPRCHIQRPVPHRRPPTTGSSCGHGRRRDQHHRRQQIPCDLRSGRGPRDGPRPRRDHAANRDVPLNGCRGKAFHRRSSTAARRHNPGRSLHRLPVMRKLDRDTLTVSDRALRHGLLVDRFG